MPYNMSSHLNSLGSALGERAAPGEVFDILQRELNVLHRGLMASPLRPFLLESGTKFA